MAWWALRICMMIWLLIMLPSCRHSTEPPLLLPDTTSHAFLWTAEFLGDGNGSHVYDVAILSDSVACLVGEFYERDSSGAFDPAYFNLAIWRSGVWRPERVYYSYQGQAGLVVFNSICALSTNEFWVAGNGVMHWDGVRYHEVDLPAGIWPPVLVERIWGSSSQNIFITGSSGALAHYDGAMWQKINAGTTGEILDIIGSPDATAVVACGYRRSSLGTYLLRGIGLAWDVAYDGTPLEFSIRQDSISGALASVYTPNSNQVFIASSAGVYEASTQTTGRGKRISFTDSWLPGFPFRIRGNAANDWFVVGEYAFVAHYNGTTLYPYTGLMNNNYRLYSVAQRGNLVIAVGELKDPINSRGLILTGRR
jgi:hypothetical protein